jgi:hypothetical protein
MLVPLSLCSFLLFHYAPSLLSGYHVFIDKNRVMDASCYMLKHYIPRVKPGVSNKSHFSVKRRIQLSTC